MAEKIRVYRVLKSRKAEDGGWEYSVVYYKILSLKEENSIDTKDCTMVAGPFDSQSIAYQAMTAHMLQYQLIMITEELYSIAVGV